MLGFELTFWDYATFATAAAAGVAFLLVYIWIAGLPGRIAIARNHPEAEAVKMPDSNGFCGRRFCQEVARRYGRAHPTLMQSCRKKPEESASIFAFALETAILKNQ